jgi:hypothetical protein
VKHTTESTSEMLDQIMGNLVSNMAKARPPRKRRPKNYDDLCWNSVARVGDVVYMPSNPDVRMTVQEIHHHNRAANNHPQEVSVQWLDANGHFTQAKMLAKTLVKD